MNHQDRQVSLAMEFVSIPHVLIVTLPEGMYGSLLEDEVLKPLNRALFTLADELQAPYLGYVKHSLTVAPVEDFTDQRLSAVSRGQPIDYALIFPTKYELSRSMPLWWEACLGLR